jgi:hypothetical protein
MKRKAFLLVLILLIVPCIAWADIMAECTRGCEDRDANRSVNLILRRAGDAPVTITWRSPKDPAEGDRIILFYAGNPSMQDAIPRRTPLVFRKEGNEWRASAEFSGAELGRGTFLTVVTSRPRNGSESPDGENEEVLDWRAFRLLTIDEKTKKEQGPKPGSAWSVTITPALLQAQSGHGLLPPFEGGDQRPWWSFVELEGNVTDLDLDGDFAGIPGIGIQVSTPWHTRDGEDWKQKIREKLTGVEGHKVRFGDLEWFERPDREADLGSKVTTIFLRHYYTVITMYTNASVKSFNKQEVGASHWFLNPTYFSHETSARLKHTDEPRFWASYSRREYSADKRLLAILQRQVKEQGRVPGLLGVQVDTGDGGEPTYTVGFYAQVRPWEIPGQESKTKKFRAGLVGVDVVAARGGIGGLVTQGSAGESSLEQVWCKVIRCNDQGHRLDLDKPPDGYQVTQALAFLGTHSGNLPIFQEAPTLAEKGVPELIPDAVNLPSKARFGINAKLRAGALLQEASWGHMKNVVPINTYAQFIVKLTVAMFPDTHLITNDDAILPNPAEFEAKIMVPPLTGILAWIKKHMVLAVLGAVAAIALPILIFVPGGLAILKSALDIFTKIVSVILQLVEKVLEKISDMVKGKKGK